MDTAPDREPILDLVRRAPSLPAAGVVSKEARAGGVRRESRAVVGDHFRGDPGHQVERPRTEVDQLHRVLRCAQRGGLYLASPEDGLSEECPDCL